VLPQARLVLELNDGRSLEFSGTGVQVTAEGEPVYVEKLPERLRPDDTGEGTSWR
jgi:hypothetical protein